MKVPNQIKHIVIRIVGGTLHTYVFDIYILKLIYSNLYTYLDIPIYIYIFIYIYTIPAAPVSAFIR